jgi:hypothetical protein
MRIGELEASNSLYCKSLCILTREETTIQRIQRSVCWHRLEKLDHYLPREYKDPNQLYLHLKREIRA